MQTYTCPKLSIIYCFSEAMSISVPEVIQADLQLIKDFAKSNQQNDKSSPKCGTSLETSSSEPSFQPGKVLCSIL
jgi:hypothetical protein